MVKLSFGKNFRRRYRHLWCMIVEGFDDREHCLKCLKGRRVAEVTTTKNGGSDLVTVEAPEGAYVYVCGVVYPFDWDSNFHLTLKATGDSEGLIVENVSGDFLGVRGAVEAPFTDEAARRLYPGLDDSFLTCRNFQFGAHYFK